jgi:hypothetical protein
MVGTVADVSPAQLRWGGHAGPASVCGEFRYYSPFYITMSPAPQTS